MGSLRLLVKIVCLYARLCIVLREGFGYWADCIITSHTLSHNYYTKRLFSSLSPSHICQFSTSFTAGKVWYTILRVSSIAGKYLECLYQVNPRQLSLEGTSGDHVLQWLYSEHGQLQQVAEHCVMLEYLQGWILSWQPVTVFSHPQSKGVL